MPASGPSVGWYDGERQIGIPGYANWYASSSNNARVFDDFVVPDGGWMVAAVFSNNSFYNAPPVREARWEIRTAVSEREPGGSLVASGIGTATQTLNANTNDYRIQDGRRSCSTDRTRHALQQRRLYFDSVAMD